MTYIKENLKYLLHHHKMNASALAKEITVSQPTLSRILKDNTAEAAKTRAETIKSIADYFGITPEQLTDAPLSPEHAPQPALNTRAVPVLEIERVAEYLANPESIDIIRHEKTATTAKHSPAAFAVRMADNSMRSTEETEESINKNDMLITEPAIPPRHEDIVVVCLNPEKSTGIVAKLEIDPLGKYRLRRTGINIAGENPIEMPDEAYICGVVTEIQRRVFSTETTEARMNKNHHPTPPTAKKSKN